MHVGLLSVTLVSLTHSTKPLEVSQHECSAFTHPMFTIYPVYNGILLIWTPMGQKKAVLNFVELHARTVLG